MTTAKEMIQQPPVVTTRWYALEPADVANWLGVAVDSGLSADEAMARLERSGPNALPVEQPPSSLRRLLAQYTSYRQLILVGAAVVSLAIQEWTTALALIVIALFNAVVVLRQEGKAESAMNALQSMMKAMARARRNALEAVILYRTPCRPGLMTGASGG
jgi:Ca2+-transporting ATPase